MARVVVEAESRDVNVYTDNPKAEVILVTPAEHPPQEHTPFLGALGDRYELEYLHHDALGPAVVKETFAVFEKRTQHHLKPHVQRRMGFRVLRSPKEDS